MTRRRIAVIQSLVIHRRGIRLSEERTEDDDAVRFEGV